jgi:hypothetical protein
MLYLLSPYSEEAPSRPKGINKRKTQEASRRREDERKSKHKRDASAADREGRRLCFPSLGRPGRLVTTRPSGSSQNQHLNNWISDRSQANPRESGKKNSRRGSLWLSSKTNMKSLILAQDERWRRA